MFANIYNKKLKNIVCTIHEARKKKTVMSSKIDKLKKQKMYKECITWK